MLHGGFDEPIGGQHDVLTDLGSVDTRQLLSLEFSQRTSVGSKFLTECQVGFEVEVFGISHRGAECQEQEKTVVPAGPGRSATGFGWKLRRPALVGVREEGEEHQLFDTWNDVLADSGCPGFPGEAEAAKKQGAKAHGQENTMRKEETESNRIRVGRWSWIVWSD